MEFLKATAEPTLSTWRETTSLRGMASLSFQAITKVLQDGTDLISWICQTCTKTAQVRKTLDISLVLLYI